MDKQSNGTTPPQIDQAKEAQPATSSQPQSDNRPTAVANPDSDSDSTPKREPHPDDDLPANIINRNGNYMALSCGIEGCETNTKGNKGYLLGVMGLKHHSMRSHGGYYDRLFGIVPKVQTEVYFQSEMVVKRVINAEELVEIRKGNVPADIMPRRPAKSEKEWKTKPVGWVDAGDVKKEEAEEDEEDK